MIATRDFTCTYMGNREEIRAGRDWIAADHEIVRRFPENFAPDGDGSVRTRTRATASTASSARVRLSPDHEKLVMSARMDELRRADRDRARGRYATASERRERSFWAATERLLGEPVERTDPVFEVDHLIAERAEADLAEIDDAWGARAPWR